MSSLAFTGSRPTGLLQFWLGFIRAIAVSLFVAVMVGIATGLALFFSGAGPHTQQLVALIGGLAVGGYAIYRQVLVAIRRCHAVGRSGWWCLLLLIPFVGPLWLLLDLSVRPLANNRPAA